MTTPTLDKLTNTGCNDASKLNDRFSDVVGFVKSGTADIFVATIKINSIKAGSDQSNAGAVVAELWRTSGHATLPDNVVMIGV